MVYTDSQVRTISPDRLLCALKHFTLGGGDAPFSEKLPGPFVRDIVAQKIRRTPHRENELTVTIPELSARPNKRILRSFLILVLTSMNRSDLVFG